MIDPKRWNEPPTSHYYIYALLGALGVAMVGFTFTSAAFSAVVAFTFACLAPVLFLIRNLNRSNLHERTTYRLTYREELLESLAQRDFALVTSMSDLALTGTGTVEDFRGKQCSFSKAQVSRDVKGDIILSFVTSDYQMNQRVS